MSRVISGVTQFTKEQLKEILQNDSWEVIDVRTPEEYQAGHIPNVPLKTMQEVGHWINELNPEKQYVFICRSGARSQRVAEFLQQRSFQNVANFSGGMLAWDGEQKSGSTP